MEEFYREYHARFFRYAWRIVGSEDKAADLVQEALTRALPSLLADDPALAVPRDFWPNYMFRVIHNLAINLVTRSREDAEDPDLLPLGHHRDVADEAADGVDVRRCLDALSPEERSAFLLAGFEGFVLREVAALLAISDDAAFRRVKTAEKKLRLCLGRDGSDA